MSLVSIIIPCFNYGHLLCETLESILLQSYIQWECFIVDDGSTDNTKNVAENYANRDGRIKYVYKSNGGLSSARNEGLKHANGEYIQFLDADDLLSNYKIENQVKILQNNVNYDIVYSDVRFFEDGNYAQFCKNYNLTDDEWMPKTCGAKETIFRALVSGNIMVVNAPLIRASLINKAGYFDESLKVLEDWVFWIACAKQNAYFYYDDNPGSWALVRVHRASMSKNRRSMYLTESILRRTRFNLTEYDSVTQTNNAKLVKLSEYLAIDFANTGEVGQSLQHFYYAAKTSGRYRYYLKSSLFWLRRAIKKSE